MREERRPPWKGGEKSLDGEGWGQGSNPACSGISFPLPELWLHEREKGGLKPQPPPSRDAPDSRTRTRVQNGEAEPGAVHTPDTFQKGPLFTKRKSVYLYRPICQVPMMILHPRSVANLTVPRSQDDQPHKSPRASEVPQHSLRLLKINETDSLKRFPNGMPMPSRS